MKRKFLQFGSSLTLALGAATSAFANNPFDSNCHTGCASCGSGGASGDTTCEPNANSNGVSITAKSDVSQTDADKKCQIALSNTTAPTTNAANPSLHGVSPNNCKRAGLIFDGPAASIKYEIKESVRTPRQMTAERSTFDIVDTADGHGYAISQYWTDQLPAADAAGIRAIPSGVLPVTKTIFRNPDGNANTTNGRLDIVHTTRHPNSGTDVTRTVRLTYPVGSNTWQREYFFGDPQTSSGLAPYRVVSINRTQHTDGTETMDEITKDRGTDGNLVITSHTNTTYAFYKYGNPAVLAQTEISGTGSDLSTTWTYYQDAKDRASFNKPATMRRNDGRWANYSYSGSELTGTRVTKTVLGWLDNPAPAVGQAADENENRVVTEIECLNETGTFSREEKINGVVVSKSWGEQYKDNAGQLVQKSRVETGTSTLVTTKTLYAKDDSTSALERGHLKSIENPDGTVELHRYAMSGANREETVETGAGTVSGVTEGTRTVRTYTSRNTLIKQVSSDIASGVELSAKEAITFDLNQQPKRWAYNHNPDDYSETIYGCCGLESERSRDGIVTTYTRDALKRLVTTVSLGVTTTNSYGKKELFPTVEVVKSSGALFQNMGKFVMDHAGNVIEQISPDLDNDGNEEVTTIMKNVINRTIKTINPDDGYVVDLSYADGKAKSRDGSAAVLAAWAYGTHSEQGGGLLTTAYAGTNVSDRWTKSYLNMGGNVFKIVAPGGDGEVAIQFDSYDNSGRIISSKDADGVTALFAYNSKGERYRTALDLNRNGMIDATDRVIDTLQDVVANSAIGAAIRVRSLIYDFSNQPVTASTRLSSLDGLSTHSELIGGGAKQVKKASIIDHLDGAWEDVATLANGTRYVTTYQNWMPANQSYFDALPASNLLGSLSIGYDALRRPNVSIQSRTASALVMRNSYNESGLIANVTEDLTQGDDRGTFFAYDVMGRKVTTTLPDNSVKHTSYWPTGLVKSEWGSQSYPTMKIYSPQGELTELRTFRSANLAMNPEEVTNPDDYDKTNWVYNNRGLLEKKLYADGKGPAYTYTPAGRIFTRTLARPVTTTYGYNNAGEVSSIEYDDRSPNPVFTPNVEIIYDKLGRAERVRNEISESILEYNPSTLRIDKETISYNLDGQPGFEFTRVLDRSQDVIGRDTGWQLKNGATVENEVAYGYSAQSGRLATVTAPSGTFSYSYTPNSSLLAQVAGPVHTVTNTWFADRDALHKKENKVGETLISSFDYGMNAIGQRIEVVSGSDVISNCSNWVWGYDALGQVTKADNSANNNLDRTYQYDAIGNRKKSADSLTLPTDDNYAVNALNQYSAIDSQSQAVNPSFDFDGNLKSGSVRPLTSSNSQAGTFKWDAENRLIEATVNSGTTVAIVKYAYDSQSRLISRTVGNMTRNYLYDGWNLVSEYSGILLQKTYTWGLDLSNSIQGVGGVGGLLAVKSGTTVHFPTFDGNGNVSEYLDSAGFSAAHFEYDPFGVAVVDTDANREFTIRFSTKTKDVDTGLYNYGMRFYDSLYGRWINRDPLEEVGSVNLFGFLNNDGMNSVDVIGLSPTGVRTIGPSEALNMMKKVNGTGFQNFFRDFFVNDEQSTAVALKLLADAFDTGDRDDGKNQFVYTCKCGWIDMGHFFNNALAAYIIKGGSDRIDWAIRQMDRAKDGKNIQALEAVKIYGGNSINNPIVAASIVWMGSFYLENEQLKNKKADPSPSNGWGHSAFTLEDLPSNALGAAFGANQHAKYDIATSLASIVDQMRTLFEKCGAVEPSNLVGKGKTAGDYLRPDADYYASAATSSFPTFNKDDSGNPLSPFNYTAIPKRTRSHACVCDDDNNPIKLSDK